LSDPAEGSLARAEVSPVGGRSLVGDGRGLASDGRCFAGGWQRFRHDARSFGCGWLNLAGGWRSFDGKEKSEISPGKTPLGSRHVLFAAVIGGAAFVARAGTQEGDYNTSSERIPIERALLALCDDLREKDPATREEFSQFTAALRKRLGKKFDPTRVPSVVQWFPSRQQFIAGGSLSSSNSTYLPLLPIGTVTTARIRSRL
jgi:hypothetical protein